MKIKNTTLLISAFALIAGSIACSSVRKNDQNNPVFKRKESLPVQSQQTSASQLPATGTLEPQVNQAANANNASTSTDPAVQHEQNSTSPDPQPRIHRMAAESRQELINSGFSPEYFDAHFTITDMVDEEYEKKIVWLYTIGDYKLEIIDPISFTMDATGSPVYTHGVRQEIGTTHDYQNLLSLKDAEAAIQKCIGEYAQSWFRLIARELPGNASVWMYARSEKEISGKKNTWMAAYLNLETGVCEKEVVGAIHQPMNPDKE